VISLNVVRRHLNTKQKRQLTAELLKETPEYSDREIARLIGIDNKTVASVRRHLEELGELFRQDETLGADGKWRTTERKSKPAKPRPPGPRRERVRRPVDAPEIDELEEMVEKLTADLAERDHRIVQLLAENTQLKREMLGLQDELKELRAAGKVGGPAPDAPRPSRAVAPPWKNGKADYAAWTKTLMAPRISKETDAQELRWLLEDNRAAIDAYEAETPGAGTGLAERIRKAIDKLEGKPATRSRRRAAAEPALAQEDEPLSEAENEASEPRERMSEEEYDRGRARIRELYGEPEADPDDDEPDAPRGQTFDVKLKDRHYTVMLAPDGAALAAWSSGRNGRRQIYPPKRGTRAGTLTWDVIAAARRQVDNS
jgi:hypothetical protein